MSASAYRARLRNLTCWKRPRTNGQTRQLELEIALWTHRAQGESLRDLARRLGCSHVHCWRVARKYRAGQIPMLPPDEQGLLAMRDSLGITPTSVPLDRYQGAVIQGHRRNCDCPACQIERIVGKDGSPPPAEPRPVAPKLQPATVTAPVIGGSEFERSAAAMLKAFPWRSIDEIWSCILLTVAQKIEAAARLARIEAGLEARPEPQPEPAQQQIRDNDTTFEEWKKRYYARRPWLR